MQPPPDTLSTSQSNSEWQNVESRKRFRDSPDNKANPNLKQSTLSDYWLNRPTPTSNRFAHLEEEVDDSQETPPSNANKTPIFVGGVTYIQPLSKLLDEITPGDYTLKCLSNNEVKILPKTIEAYGIIIKALKEKNTQFYSFRPKSEQSFRVVLRNLHPTTDLDEIKTAIEEKGHSVINIANIFRRGTKTLLPLFSIELKSKENNKDIYEITLLLHCVVKFEPPHSKREIPQCQNCQLFGHTKNYCHRSPRCVKCADNHHTNQCPRKTKDDKVKCVNCGGPHPANYRGCNTHKEEQKKKFPPLRKRTVKLAQPTPQIKEGISYAQIVSKSQQNQPSTSTSNPQPHFSSSQEIATTNLEQMLTKMMEKMDKILDLLIAVVTKK